MIAPLPDNKTERLNTLDDFDRLTATQYELMRRVADQERLINEQITVIELVCQSEKRLAEAQQVAQIGSWEYDADTTQSTWSAEMFRLLGFDSARGEPDHDTVLTHLHFEDVEMYTGVTRQAIEDGRPYELDIRILPGDGTMRWCHTVGQGERDAEGRARCRRESAMPKGDCVACSVLSWTLPNASR